jgi:hypothetical protein
MIVGREAEDVPLCVEGDVDDGRSIRVDCEDVWCEG